MLMFILLHVSCFSVLFSIEITRAGLYASRAFVRLSCMSYSLSFFFSS